MSNIPTTIDALTLDTITGGTTSSQLMQQQLQQLQTTLTTQAQNNNNSINQYLPLLALAMRR